MSNVSLTIPKEQKNELPDYMDLDIDERPSKDGFERGRWCSSAARTFFFLVTHYAVSSSQLAEELGLTRKQAQRWLQVWAEMLPGKIRTDGRTKWYSVDVDWRKRHKFL